MMTGPSAAIVISVSIEKAVPAPRHEGRALASGPQGSALRYAVLKHPVSYATLGER
jgi:hypothetical protein